MHPHLTHALRLLLLWALPISVMAQVNGNFETGFRAPQGINNIYSYQGGYQYDDLPSWEGVLVAPPNMGAYPGYSLGGDYLSTVAGAAPRVNPQGTPDGGVFQPHSGTSCVALRRFPASGNIADQGIWSQPVSIIPGHVYQLDYYVLRRPTSQYAEKIKVVVSKAGSQWASSSSTSKDISAQNMPYASVTSPVITDYQNWTHVTGTFTAQTYFTTGPNANTSWLTITYDRPLGTYDPSLYVAPGSYNFSYYAIDDVSITDIGCGATPGPLSWVYNVPPRRVRVRIPAVSGATSYNWYVDGSLQGTHSTFLDVPTATLVDCNTPVVVEVEAVSGTCVSPRAHQYFYP